MKKILFFLVIIFSTKVHAQNVGIGTTTPTENFHVVGNKAFFQTNFLGIGTNTATTAFTGFALKKNVNSFWGMYVDAGATGQPFYGYALNGLATAYHQFNGATNQYEYYHTNATTPDFQIGATQAAFPNTNFLGIGTTTPTTSFTGLTLKSNVNTYYGSYIDAGATGHPFYGYALNGVAKAYTGFNSATSAFEYHQTSDATPDFFVNGNTKAVFNTGFVGIGTSTPTTAFTGFAMKSSANTFYGSYIDAGATGVPFYGYALNGVAKSYLAFNGPNNALEYHQTSDATPDFFVNGNTKAVFNTGFVGIGTSTPTTGFTGFAMKSSANTFYGSYVDAGATGIPFYGYALNGVATAYTTYNGANSRFEYHHTSDATPDFYISNTQAAFPATNFLGIGTTTPTTGFTGLSLKTTANSYFGSYVDAGATGHPFYGYALNGVAKAYTGFNSATSAFEYHQTSDATPDFFVNGNTKAVFNTGFVGIGTSTPTTGFTGFAMKSSANTFYGSYIDAGATGTPFYGYALNGVATAYTTFSGPNNQFEYHHTTDATPDFAVSNTQATFPIQNFLGVGTSTPTNSNTGLTLKNNVAGYYGSYIDAGAAGRPFYGYALNGVPKAWTEFNSGNNNWELNYNGARISVDATGNVGIGTSTASQKLDVAGTIHAQNLNGGATTLSTDAVGNIIRTPSDATLKNKIADINNPLSKVLKMHGVTYNFKDAKRFGSNRQMGFLAQELEKIVPEAVSSGGEYKSVNYQVLTALLTEALKEQQKQIDVQNKINDVLQKSNVDLQKEITEIKKQFADKLALLEIKVNEVLAVKEKKETAKDIAVVK
jgi:hypothetical protein